MWFNVLIAFLKALFFLSCILALTSFLTWQERKQSAVMQDRLGANRAPIFGMRASTYHKRVFAFLFKSDRRPEPSSHSG